MNIVGQVVKLKTEWLAAVQILIIINFMFVVGHD